MLERVSDDDARAVEERLGVTLPEDWKRWSPETERDTVRGVLALLDPDDYVRRSDGRVVIGTTTDGAELALVPVRRNARVLKDGVYAIGDGRPRLVVPRFTDLLHRPRRTRRRPDEIAWEQRQRWARHAFGELRRCAACGAEVVVHASCACARTAAVEDARPKPSAEELAGAREAMPELFAAIDFALGLRRRLRWVGADTVLELETARARGVSPEALIERWTDRGLGESLPSHEELARFLG